MNLTGELETSPLEHVLLFGADSHFTWFKGDAYSAPLDPFDFYGVYLQDMISFGEQWKLLLGGRYDMVKTQFDVNGRHLSDKWDRAFSPRAGLVYQPIKDLSLYASYTTSFLPPLAGAGFNGRPFKPKEGEQFEVGGGLFVAGSRKADLTNRVNVDAHARVDLFARYKVNETLSLALNVDNLFDEYYVGGTYYSTINPAHRAPYSVQSKSSSE